MYKKTTEDEILNKISLILNEFEGYEKPLVNSTGDIIIKNKSPKKPSKEKLVLTNIFKKIIADDIKKNRA
jgi:hypothetical protein